MDNESLKATLNAILAAQNVSEMNIPIETLIALLFDTNYTLPLSQLRDIAETIRQRIANIQVLQDLGKDGNEQEQHPRVKIINWFGSLGRGLSRFGAYPTAINLLIDLWNQYGEYQSTLNNLYETPKHFYRAGIGMYLGQLALQHGDQGDAIWWLLHAHADDLLGTLDDEVQGAAHDLLRLAFGVGNNVFEYMKKCKDSNSREIHTLFAEHLIMQLSLNPEFSYLFSYPSPQLQFPIGRAYAKTMLDRIDQKNAAGNFEGQPLEEFVRYLVLSLTGWVPTRNMYHNRTHIDSDVVARYVREPESISSSRPRAFLVECKNRASSLGVAETGYFLYRMSLTKVDVGILFVRDNVSGTASENPEHKYSWHLIDLAFQQTGATVVVINRNDLDEIAENKKTIWTVIDSGIVERRFGKSNRFDND